MSIVLATFLALGAAFAPDEPKSCNPCICGMGNGVPPPAECGPRPSPTPNPSPRPLG